jgi:hypothetical protein
MGEVVFSCKDVIFNGLLNMLQHLHIVPLSEEAKSAQAIQLLRDFNILISIDKQSVLSFRSRHPDILPRLRTLMITLSVEIQYVEAMQYTNSL